MTLNPELESHAMCPRRRHASKLTLVVAAEALTLPLLNDRYDMETKTTKPVSVRNHALERGSCAPPRLPKLLVPVFNRSTTKEPFQVLPDVANLPLNISDHLVVLSGGREKVNPLVQASCSARLRRAPSRSSLRVSGYPKYWNQAS